ncbi:MAG TPA: homoserine kinase [Mariprofundaceae bacterium]|nr:homoserine kinase [Mariprofundaceae bacterium]
MSVYTDLSRADIEAILASYALGGYRAHQGIAAGIENSNFFIDTDTGRFVLTVFERMQADELPYFMHLMRHLAGRGLSCPDVMVRSDGSLLFTAHGGMDHKWGCIISCLPGRTVERLNAAQLHDAGRILAQLHRAGADFSERRPNPTGFAWLQSRIQGMRDDVAARYGEAAADLLTDELVWQDRRREQALPGGVVHADYFCDNILFEGDAVSGVIDFYYACDDAYAMDIAIALNALAVSVVPDQGDGARMQAFLAGYESVRPLEAAEHAAIPVLLRLAALRFWTSRLFDALYPRPGAMTQVKDPEEYRAKLLFHRGDAGPG